MTLTVSVDEIVANSRDGRLGVGRDWERVRLREVATIQNGFAFKSTRFNKEGSGLPLLRIRDVGDDRTEAFYDGDFENRYLVAPGDIVVGMDGDFRVARWRGPIALLNQRVAKITTRPDAPYDERFLLHALPGYLDAIHAQTSSVTVKHLSSRTLDDIPLPHPPLVEQQRIVAAIEEQFSRLEAAEASLKDGLARVRLAWRAGVASLIETEWPERPVGEVAEVRGGILKQPSRRPVNNTAPFLRVANVLRGVLDLTNVHEVEVFDGDLAKFGLERGDLLVVEGNGSVSQIGRSAVWDGGIPECVHQNHLIRVRPSQLLLPDFLGLCWNSPILANRISAIASSTSGLYTLSAGKVSRVMVPVPPLDVQERVVREHAALASRLASVEKGIGTGLTRSRRLRTALLREAFAGRLVRPQHESAIEEVGA